MIDLLILTTILIGLGLLVTLATIDFKTFLLPNIYVFPFGLLGILFHWLYDFHLLTMTEIILGGALGYGILWIIRWGGNKYYGQDSLGLGDVKLLAAAGLWLGVEGVMIAMTIGAMVGLLHGLIYAGIIATRNKTKFSISRLMIPAGPGFIAGIIIAFIWLYRTDMTTLVYDMLL